MWSSIEITILMENLLTTISTITLSESTMGPLDIAETEAEVRSLLAIEYLFARSQLLAKAKGQVRKLRHEKSCEFYSDLILIIRSPHLLLRPRIVNDERGTRNQRS
jgi:hypothetical protein